MAVRDRAALVIDFPSPSGKDWDEPKLDGERLEELVTLFERAQLYSRRAGGRKRCAITRNW